MVFRIYQQPQLGSLASEPDTESTRGTVGIQVQDKKDIFKRRSKWRLDTAVANPLSGSLSME